MSFVRRHLKLLIGLGIAGAALLIFVLVWFQPQTLVISKRVNEVAPTAEPMKAKAATRPLMGTFRAGEHPAKGTATIVDSADEKVVRFETFEVSNGPDLVVYLSAASEDAPWGDFAKDFVDLGPLKGNIGNQNYVIPKGTDLSKYRTVVVWCRRFTVPFAAAELEG